MWDDFLGAASAPYAALQFNDNIIQVSLYPSATALQSAIVVLSPPTQALRIVNGTRTMAEGSNTAISLQRDENGGGGIVLRGEIAADTPEIRRTVAVTDPVSYFALVLRETLREAGIAIEGAAVKVSDLEPYDPAVHNAITLFTHLSPPLSEVLPAMMKPSQNQIAESMFITVGREIGGNATADGAIAVVDSLLRAWQIDPAGLRIVDGSGLSRYNLVSPGLFVDLLTHMDSSPWRETWIESLPIGGRDGTLANRMREPPLLERVHAKTGTISTVRTLSGYLTAADGRRYVFSILSNHTLAPSSQVDRIAEAALLRLAVD
jgi:D-alanyl-D-alanine carboxypeptidase/D-alanyl-D-alanine-endopeptidase (penicillin-binding protein 4)